MRLPIASGKTVRRKLFGILKEFRGCFAYVLTLQLMGACIAVVTPQLIGHAIDTVTRGATSSFIRDVIIAMFLVVIVQAILAYIGEYEAMKLGERVYMRLRNRVVEAVTHLPLSLVEEAGTGDLLGRTTHDVERVAGFIQRGISRIIIISLTIIVTMAAAIAVNPLLGVVVLVPLPPLYFSLRWYVRRTIPAYLAAAALWAGSSGMVSETVEQLATIDALDMGGTRISRFDTLMREMWRNERYTAWVRGVFIFLLMLIVAFPVLLAVLWGVFLLQRGLVSVGTITTVALYAQHVRSPLTEISWWVDALQFTTASFSRIFGVEELYESAQMQDNSAESTGEKARISEPDILASHTPMRGAQTQLCTEDVAVSVHDVRFAYSSGRDVLHGVNLDIRRGEKLAIVGSSGAGKSTLGRLIAGINSPESGSICVYGRKVSSIAEQQRPSVVALVTQEHHSFVGTLAENLRLARAEASEAQVLAALEAVEAGSWVNDLEEGVATRIGAGGLQLTPAQAQQVALARIVLLDPHILVLDEATSLLDPGAARSLERALARVVEGRTVISIAHRLYTAHDADRVAVMSEGQIVELGSHRELVASGGQYASLWHTWQSE